jgi:hypothetical protein
MGNLSRNLGSRCWRAVALYQRTSTTLFAPRGNSCKPSIESAMFSAVVVRDFNGVAVEDGSNCHLF